MAWRWTCNKTITWTNADPVHWHIYAALGDELKQQWRSQQDSEFNMLPLPYFYIVLSTASKFQFAGNVILLHKGYLGDKYFSTFVSNCCWPVAASLVGVKLIVQPETDHYV